MNKTLLRAELAFFLLMKSPASGSRWDEANRKFFRSNSSERKLGGEQGGARRVIRPQQNAMWGLIPAKERQGADRQVAKIGGNSFIYRADSCSLVGDTCPKGRWILPTFPVHTLPSPLFLRLHFGPRKPLPLCNTRCVLLTLQHAFSLSPQLQLQLRCKICRGRDVCGFCSPEHPQGRGQCRQTYIQI